MKPVRTWILIADGARARILANNGPGKGVEPLEGLVFQVPHPENRDILSDRPGRSFDSASPSRHAMELPTDAKRQQERDFARMLADHLKAHDDAFDRLILVAAPAALGDLRQALPTSITGKVTAELAKDLTNTPNDKLGDHLAELIAL